MWGGSAADMAVLLSFAKSDSSMSFAETLVKEESSLSTRFDERTGGTGAGMECGQRGGRDRYRSADVGG